MPIGWRPTHPGDPTPKWGLNKAGRLVIVITVAVGIAIALAIIVTRPANASDGMASSAIPQEFTPVPLTWLGGHIETSRPDRESGMYSAKVQDAHVVVGASGERTCGRPASLANSVALVPPSRGAMRAGDGGVL